MARVDKGVVAAREGTVNPPVLEETGELPERRLPVLLVVSRTAEDLPEKILDSFRICIQKGVLLFMDRPAAQALRVAPEVPAARVALRVSAAPAVRKERVRPPAPEVLWTRAVSSDITLPRG